MPAGISNGGNVIFVEYTLVFSKMDSLPGEVQRIERIGYENEKNLLNCAISRLSPRERKIVELRFGLTNEDGNEMPKNQ